MKRVRLYYKVSFFLFLIGILLYGVKTSISGPYLQSIHGSTTSGVQRNNLTNFSKGNCVHCHEMHASIGGSEPAPAGGSPSLWALLADEENACYYCHGSSSNNNPALTKNIQAQFQNTYRHPVELTGRHKKPAHLETSTDLQPPNRHSECVDCHNPHVLKQTTHTYNSTSPSSNNLVSGVLLGVFGVEPSSWGTWTSPTTFNETRPTSSNPTGGATKEYQICLKCHSYYGFGSSLNTSTGVTTIIGPSGGNLTDQAREFSPQNYSFHPVVQPLGTTPRGGYTPYALTSSQMKSPWTNVGSQTMYCSDCHGAYAWDASGTQIKGPHGTANPFMLIEGRTWPKKPSDCGGGFWATSDIRNNVCNWQTNLLCAKCHPIYSGGSWMNRVHSQHANRSYTCNGTSYSTPCVACHIAIPHGSKRSRLIGYTTDPAPYNICSALRGFRKASSPSNYPKGYCYSTASGCGDHSYSSNCGGSCDP